MSELAQLPPKDVERLSAYLDRALPPSEMAEVERRLRADASFRRAHEELRQVVVAVRGLDEVRVPRNFVVREADVGRRGSRAYPVLRFATVLASGLFVLLTGVRLASPVPALQAAGPVASESQNAFALRAADAVTTGEGAPAEPEAPLSAEVVPSVAEGTMPAAAAGEIQPLATASPAATEVAKASECPDCPAAPVQVGEETSLDEGAAAILGEAVDDEIEALPSQPTGVSPLVVAQWLVGSAAIVMLVFTFRARRSR